MSKPIAPAVTPQLEQRFWAKAVRRNLDTTCWEWTGPRMVNASGRATYPKGFSAEGHTWRPSHIAMLLAGRPRPSLDLEALHSCDNPGCVNPAHLRWGTKAENLVDHLERRKPGPRCLSPDQVRAIRADPRRTFIVAREYGVTQPCIHNIRKRVTHKHIE